MRDAKIKKLEIISKALLILFVFLFLYVYFLSLQLELFCFRRQINLLILFLPLIIAVILEIIVILIRSKNHLAIKKSIESFSKFLIISLLIFFIIPILFFAGGTSRAKAIDARKMSDLRQIYEAQEKFLKEKSKYAISLEELDQPGYIAGIVKEAKSYNITFEGSADSKTWKAQVDIKQYEHEICSLRKTKKIYACNEKGCKKEVVVKE